MALNHVTLDDKYDLEQEPDLRHRLPGAGAPVPDAEGARPPRRAQHRGLCHRLSRLAARRPRPAVPARQALARPSPTSSFQAGINEDLAATALWGTQQAELRGEGKYDGVFGMWYGKGPGVDRCGDVFRHANFAGTSKHGGVLALMGDDHTAESSTTAHQSEFHFVDLMIPILNPAGVQEIIDYGLYGWAMSRYHRRLGRAQMHARDGGDHRGGRRQPRPRQDHHPRRLRDAGGRAQHPPRRHHPRHGGAAHRLQARRHDGVRARQQAQPLHHLGRAQSEDRHHHARQVLSRRAPGARRARDRRGACQRLRRCASTRSPAPGRSRSASSRNSPRGSSSSSWWRRSARCSKCRCARSSTAPPTSRSASARRTSRATGCSRSRARSIPTTSRSASASGSWRAAITSRSRRRSRGSRRRSGCSPRPRTSRTRTPYFCSGCPHNSSTVVPTGMRAYAGIGCHYMVQWMDRAHIGFTQMGGEGANWIGEAPFSKRPHVFQNLGDGTYNHSGYMAIRAAIASGINITYKILFNDAVAMTGGQANDGGLTVPQIARAGGGRRRQARRRRHRRAGEISSGEEVAGRRHHPSPRRARRRCSASSRRDPGCTVLIYDQTCAAEKRRRRKRGTFPDPDKRVIINELVCEGCGDCGVKSNCVSVQPLETEWGRKRTIDQSSCNKDFSCVKGFCPSFVTVHGAKPKKAAQAQLPDDHAGAARAGDAAAGDRAHLRHHHHRRRRHRRRHRRRAARHGRASRRQGRRRARHGRPRAEGRRGAQPHAHRRQAGGHPRHPRRRAQRRPGARRRHRGRRHQEGAGGDQARQHATWWSTSPRSCPATSPATPTFRCRPSG